MVSSIFNVRVPLPGDQVFLMNMLTDAQLIVSNDVAALLDRSVGPEDLDGEAREALETLAEHGFVTPGREHDRQALSGYLSAVSSDRTELNVTILTTLQCNF